MNPDLKLAMLAAQMCDLSYHTATVVDAITDTQVLIQRTPDFVFVAFRGSSSLKDWVTDCEAWRVPYPPYSTAAEVHHGFKEALWAVRYRVLDQIKNVTKPIIITGHSLGGALAMLFADWLDRRVNTGRPFHSVYTFGQPRVGNAAFVEHYNDALAEVTFRFVNAEDVVPRIPGVLLGYRHAGTQCFLTSDGELVVDASLWRMAWSDTVGILRSWKLKREITALSNHGLGRYIEQLNQL